MSACVVCRIRPVLVTLLPTHRPRMERVVESIHTSRYSVHDVSIPPVLGKRGHECRLNMALEAGVALAREHDDPTHEVYFLERVKHRMSRTASDVGRDPIIYTRNPATLIHGLLRKTTFSSTIIGTDVGVCEKLFQDLVRKVPKLEEKFGPVFETGFTELFFAAVTLAARR